MPDTPLTEIKTDLAVIIATVQRMEHPLDQQNGHLRADRQTLIQHTEQIVGLRKDRDEDRGVLKEHSEKLRSVELTLAQRMLTGGAGGAIVAVLWALANWLTTGNLIP